MDAGRSKGRFRHFLYRNATLVRRFGPLWSVLRSAYRTLTPSSEVVFRVAGHDLLINPKDRGIGQRLYLSGGYAGGRTKLIDQRIKPGQTVIDIGANIGFFTFQMASIVGTEGRVVAIEPDPRNFELLERSIQKSGLSNIVPVKCAVSNEDRSGTMFLSESVTANTLKAEPGHEAIQMDIVMLDTLLPKLDIEQVDFVKMDTDGSEPLAIQGLQTYIRKNPEIEILMEFSPGNLKRYFPEPIASLTAIRGCGLEPISIIDTEDVTLKEHSENDLLMLEDGENLDVLFQGARQ